MWYHLCPAAHPQGVSPCGFCLCPRLFGPMSGGPGAAVVEMLQQARNGRGGSALAPESGLQEPGRYSSSEMAFCRRGWMDEGEPGSGEPGTAVLSSALAAVARKPLESPTPGLFSTSLPLPLHYPSSLLFPLPFSPHWEE